MNRALRLLATAVAVVLAHPSTVAASPAPIRTTAAPVEAAAPVCAVQCDVRDPSLAREDTVPVSDAVVNGRHIVLHVSDVDGMAWGTIVGGTEGNAVWLDRTWSDGSSWEGLLGKTGIPAAATGAATAMYNLYDPSHHRRGMIRACGDAAGVVCTRWAHRQALHRRASLGVPSKGEPPPRLTRGGGRDCPTWIVVVYLDSGGLPG